MNIFFTIALFRITRAASYTELPGSCGSSDRTDSSERTESSRSGFVSTRAGNPLPQNGFNSSQKGITLVPMGYTGSSSSLGGPDHPLSTTLSTEEVKSAISYCKAKISCGSNPYLIFVIFLHGQNWRIKCTPKNANFSR